MLDLARTVRFCVSCSEEPGTAVAGRHNTYAAWPSMAGVGAFYEIEVRCRGEVDAQTGYAVDIRVIDEAVRREAIPAIERGLRRAIVPPGRILREVLPRLQKALEDRVHAVIWRLTPSYSVTVCSRDMSKVILSQHFEFAAAHRLHQPAWSDDENRRVFGKCNNAHGHGHNYRLEVAVETTIDVREGEPLSLPRLEQIVNERVVQRLDHRHLNEDIEEFRSLNPSVEHIARVCHGLLVEPISEAGGTLRRVTVWETEKTSCTYPAES